MRSASGGFAAAIAQQTTYLSLLWEITRRDGDVLRFTNHDQNLIYNNLSFYRFNGFTCSAILTALDHDIPNIQIEFLMRTAEDIADIGPIDEGLTEGVTEDDLKAGVYDNQRCTVYAVDRSSGQGITIFTGETGQVEWLDVGNAKINVTGLKTSRKLATEVYSPTCRADLGDERCKVDIEALKETFTVTAVVDTTTFQTDVLNQPNDAWRLGIVVWDTGANIYSPMEINTSDQATKSISLMLELPFPIAVGDTGTVYPGCLKTVEACKGYNNIANMRAEPFGPAPATTG